jgi:hypothetical protein
LILCSFLTVCIGACGDDGGDNNDADAAVEPAPDAMPEVGACGVKVNFEAFPGTTGPFPVVFGDAQGTYVSDTVTDGEGVARKADCVGDTTITIINADDPARVLLSTFMGVRPGQTAELGYVRPVAPPDPNSFLSVTLSDVNQPGTASSFHWRAGNCGRSALINVDSGVTLTPGCLGNTPGTVDVLARAEDAESNIVGWDYALDQNVIVDATTSVATDGWEAPVDQAYSISGIPAGSGTIEFTANFLRDGLVVHVDQASEAIAGATVSGGTSAPPAAFTELIQYSAEAHYDDNTQRGAHGATSPGASIGVDISASPARIAGVLIGLADITRPELTFVTDGDVGGADLLYGTVVWTDTPGVRGWSIYQPASYPSPARAPQLPPSLVAHAPTPTSTIMGGSITVMDFTASDYATVIQSAALQPLNNAFRNNITAGSTVYASYAPYAGAP